MNAKEDDLDKHYSPRISKRFTLPRSESPKNFLKKWFAIFFCELGGNHRNPRIFERKIAHFKVENVTDVCLLLTRNTRGRYYSWHD